MFKCRIEVLMNMLPALDEPDYIRVGEYDFEPPGLQVGQELIICWKVWDKPYRLKCKVVGRQTENYSKGSHETYTDESFFLLRVFVEAEDRDIIVEIKERLKKNN